MACAGGRSAWSCFPSWSTPGVCTGASYRAGERWVGDLMTGERADVVVVDDRTMPERVPSLSFFFPAHNEAENIEAFVDEALTELPRLADEFEIIAVDDGSKDGTGAIADRLAADHPQVRVLHHQVNRGYGGALRSGFAASRYPLVAFTDGDRQFKIADVGR